MTKPTDTQELELGEVLDTVSKYNKLGGRGHADLEDNCYICGISPAKLKQAIEQNYISKGKLLEAIDNDIEITAEFAEDVSRYLTATDMVKLVALVRHQIKSALGLEEEK